MLSQFNKVQLIKCVRNVWEGIKASGGDFSAEDLVNDEQKKHLLTEEEKQYVLEQVQKGM